MFCSVSVGTRTSLRTLSGWPWWYSTHSRPNVWSRKSTFKRQVLIALFSVCLRTFKLQDAPTRKIIAEWHHSDNEWKIQQKTDLLKRGRNTFCFGFWYLHWKQPLKGESCLRSWWEGDPGVQLCCWDVDASKFRGILEGFSFMLGGQVDKRSWGDWERIGWRVDGIMEVKRRGIRPTKAFVIDGYRETVAKVPEVLNSHREGIKVTNLLTDIV